MDMSTVLTFSGIW